MLILNEYSHLLIFIFDVKLYLAEQIKPIFLCVACIYPITTQQPSPKRFHFLFSFWNNHLIIRSAVLAVVDLLVVLGWSD